MNLPVPSRIDPLLRLDAVERITGLKRSWIYKNVRAGNFPAPVRMSPRAVGWRESELARWIEACQKTVEAAEAARS